MRPELSIQRLLRDPRTTTEEKLIGLKTAIGITARRHGMYPNLVLFKYDQIASPFAEKIVRECRGVILDERDDWNVVSMAFTKFFNHGEGHAAAVDWSTARVQEKVDGSLCVMYPYEGEWHVATSGTPDACGDVHGALMRFEEYFWGAYNAVTKVPPVDCGHCFFFELTGPLNRIVVPHTETSLTLLGGRNLTTLEEITAEHAARYYVREVRPVREFALGSFEQILASFDHISPLSQEGYVVVDGNFNRVKVKHPGYVALHHAKDGLGTKAFVEIARSGETSEVLAAFPEFEGLLKDAKERLDALVAETMVNYERLKDIPEQKAFALEAVKTRCSAALFQKRAGKFGAFREFFKNMPINSLMVLLGYKEAT